MNHWSWAGATRRDATRVYAQITLTRLDAVRRGTCLSIGWRQDSELVIKTKRGIDNSCGPRLCLFAGHWNAGSNRLQGWLGNVGTPTVTCMVNETDKWQRWVERNTKPSSYLKRNPKMKKKNKYSFVSKIQLRLSAGPNSYRIVPPLTPRH